MIDAVGLVTGAGVLLAGFLLGLVVGIRLGYGEHRRPVKPLKPICACGHIYGTHVTGDCRGSIKRERWDRSGNHAGYEYAQCACQKYTGPEPLSSDIWVPPMLPEQRQP